VTFTPEEGVTLTWREAIARQAGPGTGAGHRTAGAVLAAGESEMSGRGGSKGGSRDFGMPRGYTVERQGTYGRFWRPKLGNDPLIIVPAWVRVLFFTDFEGTDRQVREVPHRDTVSH
jgi:hypothetical protein